MAIELTREERDAVRSEILTALTEVGDFTTYLDGGEIAKARRVSDKFHEYVALLDDLGWDEEDDRESFEVTVPPEELARLLPRLRLEVAGSLTTDILDAQFNQRGTERSALASAVFSRMAHEVETTDEDEPQDPPPAA